jgi:formate dehydrogenase subunit gamma
VHFVFACTFLYGTFFYLGNTIISRKRFFEHLPTRTAVKDTINHYGSLLGIKRFTMPQEEKYFQSERLAYVVAVTAAGLLVVSGLVKVLDQGIALPDVLMNVVNWMHDICAVLIVLFIIAHVLMGALLPMAWKTVPSMIFGWVNREVAEKEHPAWMEKLPLGEPKVPSPTDAERAPAQSTHDKGTQGAA